MIQRSVLKKVMQHAKLFPAIGIIGPRQVGKTTLVKEIIKQSIPDAIYIDLERNADLAKLNEPDIFLRQYMNTTVVIDEIQRKPDIFSLLRALIDENRMPKRFFLLGSASPVLLWQSSESLAGRIGYVELFPFNWLEVQDIKKLSEHHFFGGYPSAALAADVDSALLWLDNYIQTYVERDLPMFGLSADMDVIRRFWEMLAWVNGNLFNAAELGKSLGVSYHTVQRYLRFFENAFMVYQLQPFYINAKKRLVKSTKIYLRDTGILHSLLRIGSYDQLLGMPAIGASWEAYVLNQLLSLLNRELNLYFYRTQNGAEADLVIAKGLKPISCVEIKFTNAPEISKGFRICIDDLKTEHNFIITPGADDYMADKQIQICSLHTFLGKHLSLLGVRQ